MSFICVAMYVTYFPKIRLILAISLMKHSYHMDIV